MKIEVLRRRKTPVPLKQFIAQHHLNLYVLEDVDQHGETVFLAKFHSTKLRNGVMETLPSSDDASPGYGATPASAVRNYLHKLKGKHLVTRNVEGYPILIEVPTLEWPWFFRFKHVYRN